MVYTPRVGEQLELNLLEYDGNASVRNGSGFSDPAFANNKLLPIHRWVPWIAGFSSNFVRDAINRHLDGEGVVLDPFSGVGTTLVEATKLGYESVGFEINPFAALACRVKAGAGIVVVENLKAEIEKFQAFYIENSTNGYRPKRKPPTGFKTRAQFYSTAILNKVLLSWDFIDSITNGILMDMFRLAFASTMITYSNYSYEPSLGRRTSAGKSEIEDYPVGEKLLSKLREMLEDVVWLQENAARKNVSSKIVNDSFFNYQKYLDSSSIDLIVTSPPYLNNYHYNRNTRPQLYWLSYAENPQDMKPLEDSNFGKYWQTVREQQLVPLKFTLPNTDIVEKLEALRKINCDKGIYGGNGWANYAATYFNDCQRFSQAIRCLLKPGGTALVVIGNSILQGLEIPTDEYFGKIAERNGLELVEIHMPRATRIGNSIIQSGVRVTKAGEQSRLYEAVVELRKQ
ncbi:MAG: DNA methyltransferase [Dehalococcoidia bacterium]|jgi:DNA modification methylase